MRRPLMLSSSAIGVWLVGSALQGTHGPPKALSDLLSLIGFLGTVLFVLLWWSFLQIRSVNDLHRITEPKSFASCEHPDDTE